MKTNFTFNVNPISELAPLHLVDRVIEYEQGSYAIGEGRCKLDPGLKAPRHPSFKL